MNPIARKAAPLFLQEAVIYTGLSFAAAVLAFITQAVFSRSLAPGEFGVLSAATGLVLLLGVPLSAVNQTLVHHLARFHAGDDQDEIKRLHLLAFAILRIAAFATGGGALLVAVVFPGLLFASRPLLEGAVLLTAITLLATTLSGALCLGLNRFRLWGVLIIAAALLRLILALALTGCYPRAEMALAITAAASLITSAPVCWRQNRNRGPSRLGQILAQKDFLLYLAASLSVVLALFLFSSGDQIIAQYGFGQMTGSERPDVQASVYDNYQAAGLLGRALIWGTAPILAIAFTQISRETLIGQPTPLPRLFFTDHPSPDPSGLLDKPAIVSWAKDDGFFQQAARHKSLQLLFLYFGVLLFGAISLGLLRGFISTTFQGHAAPRTAHLIPGFIIAMVPLGLLQAVGIFCLASKRLPECFALGASALLYAAALSIFGKSPEQMLAAMFVGAGGVILFMIFVVFRCRMKIRRV